MWMQRGFLVILFVASLSLLAISSPTASQTLITGQQNWVNLLCKFSDTPTEPFNAQAVTDKFTGAGSINEYWSTVSYNTLTLTSQTVGWITLPHPKSYYQNADVTVSRGLILQECGAVADPLIDFSELSGVNLIVSEPLNTPLASGTRAQLTLDGVTSTYGITWITPWEFAQRGAMTQLIGLALGLSTSDNSDNDNRTDDNPWDMMSQPLYGCPVGSDCMPQHPIAYHKVQAGWVTAQATYNGTATTYTVNYLDIPAAGGVHMITVAAGNNTFYTVEARRKIDANYDVSLPGSAVIIHYANPANPIPVILVGGIDREQSEGAGAMWIPGETYQDVMADVTIQVVAQTETGFTVTVAPHTVLTNTPTPTPQVTATLPPPPTEAIPDLINNGSFESYNLNNRPTLWIYQGANRSRVICTNASVGSCAFRLRDAGRVYQIADPQRFAAGDRVMLSFDVLNQSAQGNFDVLLFVRYLDPLIPADRIIIIPAGNNPSFRSYAGMLKISGQPAEVQVILRFDGLAGKVLVDNVWLQTLP